MAHAKRKNGSAGPKASGSNSWGGWFVKCDIPSEHFDQIDKIPVDFNRLAEWEAGVVMSGKKLSVSFKAETGSYVASITDQLADSPTYQGTLSAFSGSYWGAKIALWWKHEELLSGQWKNDTERDTRYG